MQEINNQLPERWLKMEIFTEYHRLTGQVLTAELRTNGVLNATEPQLLLEQVSTSYLLRPTADTIASGFARVTKESIILVIPFDDHETDRLQRAAKIYSRGELLQQRVMIGLGSFEVSGNLHLNPGIELTQAFMYRNELFIGMTDVSVVFLPNPTTRFTANSVLINRGQVDFVCAGAP